MAVLWFYGCGSDISGPVSGLELAALVGAGRILPTDTVWRDGTEEGVPAARVRHLFPADPAAPGGRGRPARPRTRAVAGRPERTAGWDPGRAAEARPGRGR